MFVSNLCININKEFEKENCDCLFLLCVSCSVFFKCSPEGDGQGQLLGVAIDGGQWPLLY